MTQSRCQLCGDTGLERIFLDNTVMCLCDDCYLKRRIEQIIYDSEWIYNTPKVTVQGMTEQIMALVKPRK